MTTPTSAPLLLRRISNDAGMEPREYLVRLLAAYTSRAAAARAIRVSPKTLYNWRLAYGLLEDGEES